MPNDNALLLPTIHLVLEAEARMTAEHPDPRDYRWRSEVQVNNLLVLGTYSTVGKEDSEV